MAIIISVLLASFTVGSIPQAKALTPGTQFWNLSSATLGNSKVCGDHVCKPGEKTQWLKAIDQSQRSHGKIGDTSHGETVMDKLAGSTSISTSMHGNEKMPAKMNMTGNTSMPITGTK